LLAVPQVGQTNPSSIPMKDSVNIRLV